MKRKEVTAAELRKMGYKAMVEFITLCTNQVHEATEQQSRELFDLVAWAARKGKGLEIRRQHARGTVIVLVEGTYHQSTGAQWQYFLQRPMSQAEIMEESIRTGVWVTVQ